MSLHLDRRTSELADAFMAGRLPRRAFVSRLLALGLTPTVAGSILALCTRETGVLAAQSSVPSDVSGDMRFMIGPWTDKEVEHHETIAAAFNELYPNVKFSFKLYDWPNSSRPRSTPRWPRRHDIYYFGEGRYLERVEQTDGLRRPDRADQRSRLGRREGEVPLLGSHRGLRSEADRPTRSAGTSRTRSSSNMDMVKAAGFDETFVDDWDTFVDCVTKMTKGPTPTVSASACSSAASASGISGARAAGGSYLNADLSAPAINTPEVVEATQQLVDFFSQGDRAAARHVRLQHGAGRLHRRPVGDLFVRSDHRRRADGQAGTAHLRVGGPALPPGSESARQLQRHRSLRYELQDAEQGPRLGGPEVLDERRASAPTGRASRAPIRPASTPRRWATTSTPCAAARRLVRSLPEVQRRARAVRGNRCTIEAQAEAQAARAYSGEIYGRGGGRATSSRSCSKRFSANQRELVELSVQSGMPVSW